MGWFMTKSAEAKPECNMIEPDIAKLLESLIQLTKISKDDIINDKAKALHDVIEMYRRNECTIHYMNTQIKLYKNFIKSYWNEHVKKVDKAVKGTYY